MAGNLMDKVESVGRTLSLVAIPVVLAFVGAWTNDALQRRQEIASEAQFKAQQEAADAQLQAQREADTAAQDRERAMQYLELAVDILAETPEESSDTDGALRAWAVEIVSKYSPIPFSSDARKRLQTKPLSANSMGRLVNPAVVAPGGTRLEPRERN